MNAQEKKPGTEPGTKERLIDAIKEYDDLAREVAEILAEEIRTAQRRDVPTIRLVDEMANLVILKTDPVFEALLDPMKTDVIPENAVKLERLLVELAGLVLDEKKRSAYYRVPLLPFIEKMQDVVLDKMPSQQAKIWRLVSESTHSSEEKIRICFPF